LKLFRRSRSTELRWGREPNQLVDVYLPDGDARGSVAVIHGGFWRAMYGREGLAEHCRDLASRGFVAGNVAYRRIGEAGGGWPGTGDDVAAGLQALAREHGPLVGVVGHSAGGQLALWGASHVAPRPRVAVSVAGVNDLARANELEMGRGAVRDLTGGDPATISDADPTQRVPLGVRTVLITPTNDPVVSREVSQTYFDAAIAAGDDVELVDVVGDHFSVLDTGSAVWAAVVAALESA
jgi:acetyl esterase/lipase